MNENDRWHAFNFSYFLASIDEIKLIRWIISRSETMFSYSIIIIYMWNIAINFHALSFDQQPINSRLNYREKLDETKTHNNFSREQIKVSIRILCNFIYKNKKKKKVFCYNWIKFFVQFSIQCFQKSIRNSSIHRWRLTCAYSSCQSYLW